MERNAKNVHTHDGTIFWKQTLIVCFGVNRHKFSPCNTGVSLVSLDCTVHDNGAECTIILASWQGP